MDNNPIKVKLFYSYSHRDDALRDELEIHLKMLNRQGYIDSWHDRKIGAGKNIDGEIDKELENSDIILLLVSPGFLASDYCYDIEVKKAMQLHEEKKARVIPVILKESDWKETPFAKLKALPEDSHPVISSFWHNQDQAFNSITQGIKVVVKEIREERENKNKVDLEIGPKINTSLLNNYEKPSPLFTGRENELLQFKMAFAKFNLIAVEGLGGTGKTDFVAKCIEKFIDDKAKIVWLSGDTESKFDLFIESAGYGYVLKGENKTQLAVFSGFRDLIERDELIIVWDNFQTITDAAFNKFIEFAHGSLEKSTFIFVTKKEILISDASISTIPLAGLGENAFEYAKSIKELKKYDTISDDDLIKLCQNTVGHPLAIQLAMPLISKGLSVDKLIEGIVQYKELKEVEQLTKRIFTEIYNHPSTTDEERILIQRFSVFKEKVLMDAIGYIYTEKDFFVPLTNLIDKFLISRSTDFYEAHPLIKAFSYELLEDKISTHTKAAEYYITLRTDDLNPALEEQIYYHLSQSNQWERMEQEIEDKGRQFILLGQLSLVKELLDNLLKANIHKPVFNILLGDIAQLNGRWDEAKKHFEDASNQSSDKRVKVEGMIKYGEMLYRKGEIKQSLVFFEDAYHFANDEDLVKEKARALNDIGLVHEVFGDYNISLERHMESLNLRKDINDKDGIASSFLNIGSLYRKWDNLEDALDNINKGLRIVEEIGNRDGIATAMGEVGNILSDKSRFEEALDMHRKSLIIFEEIGDKVGASVAIGNIGTALLDTGKSDEALEIYYKSLKANEEIGRKEGIATILGNMSSLYLKKNELEKSLDTITKSILINEEIGNKRKIANNFNSRGIVYIKMKLYDKGIYDFFQSLSLSNQMKMKKAASLGWLVGLRDKTLGLTKFKELAKEIYFMLPIELKQFIPINELCKEPVHIEPKIGRNDPCPCGSGKKYKNCHGKS